MAAHLVNVADGFHLWADEYDLPVKDVFAVLTQVSTRVAHALQECLAPGEGTAHSDLVATDSMAYRCYLQGKQFYYRFSDADNVIAVDAFKAAIAIDPAFAPAHAGLAMACVARLERGWEADDPGWMQRAFEACSRAVALDPRLSEPYSARGLLQFRRKRLDEAESDVRRALSLNPNDEIAHNLLGRVYFQRGMFLDAAREFRAALKISPDYVWCLNDLGWAYWVLGRFKKTEKLLKRVLHIHPLQEVAHLKTAAQ